MRSSSRKTPLAQELYRNKIGQEFVFRLIEDLVQVPTDGSGTPGRFDAELLFDVDDDYQSREDLTTATEPCVAEVADYGRHSFMGWKGQHGRGRWKLVEVIEEGETVKRLVGEILSLQHVGPNFACTLPGNLGSGATVTGVELTLAGQERDDISIADALSYIQSGASLKKGWTCRFYWDYERRKFVLLDSPICPT